MTRMERRRRRRRILRIKLATTAAVLALTTASIVALTGGAAETASEPTPQPPALQAEPVLLVAEHDSTQQRRHGIAADQHNGRGCVLPAGRL